MLAVHLFHVWEPARTVTAISQSGHVFAFALMAVPAPIVFGVQDLTLSSASA